MSNILCWNLLWAIVWTVVGYNMCLSAVYFLERKKQIVMRYDLLLVEFSVLIPLVAILSLLCFSVYCYADSPQTIETAKVSTEAMIASILSATQNQIGWVGTVVAIMGVSFAIFGIFVPLFSTYQINEWRKSLQEKTEEHEKRLYESVREYEKKMEEKIDLQGAYHEERAYRAEDILLKTLEKRFQVLSGGMTQQDFVKMLNDHQRDTVSMQQLLVKDPSEVANALNRLLGRTEVFPEQEMLDFLELLKDHGRLSDPLVQRAAAKLREQLEQQKNQHPAHT